MAPHDQIGQLLAALEAPWNDADASAYSRLFAADAVYVSRGGAVSQGRDEKEALDNIKEAIVGWLWAEDQKAAASLRSSNQEAIVVAV